MAVRQTVTDLFSGLLQRIPKRRTKIWVKGKHKPCLFCCGNGLSGRAAYRFICHGQRSIMKDAAVSDQFLRYLFLCQHHVGARPAIKGEISISIGFCLYNGKGSMDILIHKKTLCRNPGFFQRPL